MTNETLKGLKVAVLVTDGFEEPELTEPVKALKDAGAQVTIISPSSGEIQGVRHDIDKTVKIKIDRSIKDASADEFDAVQLPGGAVNADRMRMVPEVHYHTTQDDVRNAGGTWVDQEVVEDGNWVTSRQPSDIPAFNRSMIVLFSRARARAQQTA